MALRKATLTLCIFLTALCCSVFAEDQQITHKHCLTLCNMNTQIITIGSPFPGLNVPIKSLNYFTGTIKPALTGLGFNRDCSEGGCTYQANKPVDCSTAKKDLGRCNFPNSIGHLKSPINVNWVY